MKIFIVGLPTSGRTSVSKELCSAIDYRYVDATSWAKQTFREQKESEHIQQFLDEYHHYLTNRMRLNPDVFINNINETIASHPDAINFVIDGVNSPRDLARLFDYNQDVIVFLNRTDSEPDFRDYENVGLTVMRDYCYWLSSAGLLPKERWLEFNFKIPGEDSESVKQLGSKNSLFIVKSINKVISFLIEKFK
jgi:hypothetical protein